MVVYLFKEEIFVEMTFLDLGFLKSIVEFWIVFQMEIVIIDNLIAFWELSRLKSLLGNIDEELKTLLKISKLKFMNVKNQSNRSSILQIEKSIDLNQTSDLLLLSFDHFFQL